MGKGTIQEKYYIGKKLYGKNIVQIKDYVRRKCIQKKDYTKKELDGEVIIQGKNNMKT